MKKILSIILLLFAINSYSQVGYWTAYNFNVEEGSEELVLKYFNEYFSNNKLAEGVTVSLFENHFKDTGWNFSHQILFGGPLDGLAEQYSLKVLLGVTQNCLLNIVLKNIGKLGWKAEKIMVGLK